MFKNILVVTLIPTFISVFTLIYTLLPKIFIHTVVEFFYNIEIPFVVYYFAIALFIFIFGFTIIKLQKRFKEQNEKLDKVLEILRNLQKKGADYNRNARKTTVLSSGDAKRYRGLIG